jgi:hypothetical protein
MISSKPSKVRKKKKLKSSSNQLNPTKLIKKEVNLKNLKRKKLLKKLCLSK